MVVTYTQAIEGELREPTAEELAEPWVILQDVSVSKDATQSGVRDTEVIRAVVTIEGMNRELGTATIKDSRGIVNVITGVEPEKMEGVTLGQTAVVVYTQALALSLRP